MYILYKIIYSIVEILRTLILIRIVISWIIPNSRNEFVELVYAITEPILRPFRILIPLGGVSLDLSPIIAFYVIGLIRTLSFRVLSMLF